MISIFSSILNPKHIDLDEGIFLLMKSIQIMIIGTKKQDEEG